MAPQKVAEIAEAQRLTEHWPLTRDRDSHDSHSLGFVAFAVLSRLLDFLGLQAAAELVGPTSVQAETLAPPHRSESATDGIGYCAIGTGSPVPVKQNPGPWGAGVAE